MNVIVEYLHSYEFGGFVSILGTGRPDEKGLDRIVMDPNPLGRTQHESRRFSISSF